MENRTHRPEKGVREERRFQSDRRQTWTANELYSRLRSKREEIENERRHGGGRRSTDEQPAPSHDHAA